MQETLHDIHRTALDNLISQVDIADGLTEHQRSAVESVLSKYRDTFSMSEDDIGLCKEVAHSIRTTDNIPVRVPHAGFRHSSGEK